MATVNDNDPRVEYTATASQTTFTRPFFLNAEVDLDVYINGVLTASGYTHTGVGSNSGTIVFSSGRTAGDVVILNRTTAKARTSSYSNDQPIPASSLEDDNTRALLLEQESARDVVRSMRAPVTDIDIDVELPAKATRASKFLAFDADGNPTASAGTGSDTGLRDDLASQTAGQGASLVKIESGMTVEDVLGDSIRHGIFKVPTSLDHYIGNIIYRKRKDGSSELLNDLSVYAPAGAYAPFSDPSLKVYYVDPDDGDDTYSGLNWSNALEGVDAALAKSDVDVIAIKGGTTIRVGNQMGTYTGTRDIVMVGVGKRVRMTTASSGAWSATGGATPNVYEQSSGGTVVGVVDARTTDTNGWYSSLTSESSIAIVNSTPGSWFYDSGAGKTYIRLSDDADPSSAAIAADVFALRASTMRFSAPGVKMYINNIHFIGGSGGAISARDGDEDSILFTEDCLFSHMYNSDAVDIADIGLYIAVNCGAGSSFEDGFSYRELNGLSPHFIEINCWSTGNYGDDTSNGSTAHNSVRGLRLNCDYGFNTGPGVADVNSSKTYNVNITSRGNTGSSNAGGVQATGTAEVWYDGLACSDNQAEDARAADTSTFHYRDMWLEDVDVDNEDGTATIDQDFT